MILLGHWSNSTQVNLPLLSSLLFLNWRLTWVCLLAGTIGQAFCKPPTPSYPHNTMHLFSAYVSLVHCKKPQSFRDMAQSMLQLRSMRQTWELKQAKCECAWPQVFQQSCEINNTSLAWDGVTISWAFSSCRMQSPAHRSSTVVSSVTCKTLH